MTTFVTYALGRVVLVLLSVWGCSGDRGFTQEPTDHDERVRDFLSSNAFNWNDMNVPVSDGKLLYDLILENNYKSALEIGTSTGHSAIWMAWALSKTGGKLITIEIDERRYNIALENFKKAGLSRYVEAHLADAHELVKTLQGPFDFIFCDADKGWYLNYFNSLNPKLVKGGCYTAHNIGMPGVREYFNHVKSLSYYETTIDNRGSGMAISYKKSDE